MVQIDGAHQSKGRHIATSCPSFTGIGMGLFRIVPVVDQQQVQVIVRWLSRRLPPRVVTAADASRCMDLLLYYGPWRFLLP